MANTANSASATNMAATANSPAVAASVTILEQGRVGGIGDVGRGAGVGAGVGAGASGVTRESDIVGWWKLNESSGTSAADSSATNNAGTSANMSDDDWVAGKNGNCLEFDGTNDHVAVPANAAYPSSDFSISCWINRASESSPFPPVIESQSYTATGSFVFRITTGNKLTFYLNNTTTAPYDFSVTNTVDTWYHIAAVYTASAEEVVLYYDGSSVGTVDVGSATIDDWADNGFWIGRDRSSFYWKGKIDDVRIYDVALSNTEVGDIYNSGDGDWA